MVKILLLFLILPLKSYALNGVITVLEAPIFGEPDENSKVIQYYRKGEDIFIHNQETADEPYKNVEFKYKEIIKEDLYPDPLLENPYSPDKGSKFYKTLARSGREAYVLKEHVFIEYKDVRELGQEVTNFDHTDYRIEEPLPRDYPFLKDTSYRGNFNVALGRPNYDPYPYQESVRDVSFNISTEINFIWSQSQEIDTEKRFYFGGIGGIHFSSQQFVMETQDATQRNFRLYLGPHASYDIFKDEKNIFTMYMNTQVYLFDRMDISISGFDASDKRAYQSEIGISPNIGAHYQLRNYFERINVSFGANLRASLPRTYESREAGVSGGLWRKASAGDSYYQSFITEVTYFIAFVNAY